MKSTVAVLYLKAMAKIHVPTHRSRLRYDLAPDDEARQALDETFAAYGQMMKLLGEIVPDRAGANLVTLHDLAYETIRERTALPARLVTLG
ncbi:hypothetical protein, partial [Priestia megaterium]|uniref:hypothetical protein n=1 Tax=Priestia megaterium TaxID=1404 RepID=UPI001C3F4516